MDQVENKPSEWREFHQNGRNQPKTVRCSLCGVLGHNRRWCPTLKPQNVPRKTATRTASPLSPKCSSCKREGHNSRGCPEVAYVKERNYPEESRSREGVKCSNCRESGHNKRNCLNPKADGPAAAKPCLACGEPSLPTRRQCRKCYMLRRNEQAKDPEFRKATRHSSFLSRLRKFGLTAEDHASLSAKQGGVCAVCRRPEEAKIDERFKDPERRKTLAIDHDHTTGKVRGLLCTRCNVAIGALRESPALFASALAYLKAPPFEGSLEPDWKRLRASSWRSRGTLDEPEFDKVAPY